MYVEYLGTHLGHPGDGSIGLIAVVLFMAVFVCIGWVAFKIHERGVRKRWNVVRVHPDGTSYILNTYITHAAAKSHCDNLKRRDPASDYRLEAAT